MIRNEISKIVKSPYMWGVLLFCILINCGILCFENTEDFSSSQYKKVWQQFLSEEKNLQDESVSSKDKAEKYMQSYKYEDIQSVELILNHRYESYGTPIAKDWYVLDYRFKFKDGNHFYFYWPITLDDDSRFIGTILDEKVENIIDKDHVIDALKNGIHLNDYVRGTEE